jgi:hypothetical protein
MAQAYAIAPGNNNTAGLLVVTSIMVAGVPCWNVQGVGQYDPGEERVYADGSRGDVGEGFLRWLSTRMTWAQYEYILSTILNGRRSGPVTARTRLNGSAYVTCNAWLTMPKTIDLERVSGSYLNVNWTFTRVKVIS